jgi:Lambda phage tail tape-measure protein (Tape_meas_lam_C)
MADIDVTLGIDNKQAIRALNAVEKEVGNVKKSFDSLKGVQAQIGKINNSFDQLKGAIAGLAIADFIKDTYAYAKANQGLVSGSDSAVAAQENFAKILDKTRIILISILKPFNDFIASIDVSDEAISKLTTNIKVFGSVITALLIVRLKPVLATMEKIAQLSRKIGLTSKDILAGTAGAAAGAAVTFPRVMQQDDQKTAQVLRDAQMRSRGAFRGIRNDAWNDIQNPSNQANLLANLNTARNLDIRNLRLQNAALTAQLKLEQSLIGASENKAEVDRALFQLDQQRLNTVNQLQIKLDTMSSADIGAGGRKVVQGQIAETNRLYERQALVLESALKSMQDLREEEQKKQRWSQEGLARAEAMEEERLAIEEFVDAKKREYLEWERSRLGITGWNQAWQEFTDETNNRAKIMYDTFNTVISSLDDAIDGFVRGTRRSFKDLFRGIVEDLFASGLKSALRQVLVTSGAKGFFESTFAGFFAEGGYIPAGQYGVVGERGPELVSGPAQVTPMNGGGSIINNYISAVDAKSVAQLFAENRKTLLGVTEQAKKELNYKGMM